MNDSPILGQIIDNNEKRRDAIHVAVAPVVANCDLQPGQHVGFVLPNDSEVVGPCEKNIGIVDPFLAQIVKKGERFWLLMYPNTVTGMRHYWRHPAFNVGRKL